jgi:hypothetical protein
MIHVLLHFKRFSARVSGRRITTIVCEKCGETFHYELVRNAYGEASSLYGLYAEATQRRADRNAQKRLTKKLEHDVELVPCPACDWVNADEVARFRKTRYPGLATLGWVFFIMTLVFDSMLYLFADTWAGHAPSLRAKELWILGGAGLSLVLAVFLLEFLLRLRIDPNRRDAQNRPRVPMGTPPAMRLETDANGEQVYVKMPREFAMPEGRIWAVYRPGQLVFEPVCCQCLAPATHIFTIPLAAFLPVPVCAICHGRIQRLWWLKLGATVTVAAAAAAAAYGLMENKDTGIAVAIVTAIAGLIVGVGLARYSSMPFRHRVLDKERGIEGITFRNPAYAALLIRRMGESDGIEFR